MYTISQMRTPYSYNGCFRKRWKVTELKFVKIRLLQEEERTKQRHHILSEIRLDSASLNSFYVRDSRICAYCKCIAYPKSKLWWRSLQLRPNHRWMKNIFEHKADDFQFYLATDYYFFLFARRDLDLKMSVSRQVFVDRRYWNCSTYVLR